MVPHPGGARPARVGYGEPVPLLPPPPNLVRDGQVAVWGSFAGVIPAPDLEAARPWGPLSGLRLKRWYHAALVHPEVGMTFAFVDAGYQRLAWVQVVDRATGRAVEVARQAPWLDVHVAPALGDDRSHVRASGLRIDWWAHLAAGRHRVDLRAGDVVGFLHLHADRATPLEVVLPLGRGRAMWSHKVPLPAEGTLAWGGRTFTLDPEHTTVILDLHKAHYPHHTWWKWATFAGRDAAGRRIAANFTDNVAVGREQHENALWVDGVLSQLAPPAFHQGADPWRVDGEGTRLAFAAGGERREDLNLGVVRSSFRQRHGVWSGAVAGHEVPGAWGLAEDHTSAW
jgi:hypothetical protein